jgi:hypothetical protein
MKGISPNFKIEIKINYYFEFEIVIFANIFNFQSHFHENFLQLASVLAI